MKEHIQRSLTLLLALALATSACATGPNGQASKETAPTAVETAKGVAVSDIQATVEEEVVTVTVSATGPLSYTAFELEDPNRIVLDMNGVDLSRFTSTIPLDNGLAEAIRPYYFAATNDGRIEVDLGRPAIYNIDDSAPSQLIITIRSIMVAEAPVEAEPMMVEPAPMVAEAPVEAEPMVVEPAPMVAEAPVEAEPMMAANDPIDELIVEPTSTMVADGYRVTEVGFQQRGEMARIVIDTNSDEPVFELLNRPTLNRLTIDLPGATIAKDQERVISVDLDESSVKNVAAFQFRSGKNPMAKVVVNLENRQLYNVYRKGRQVLLDIGDEAVLALASEAPKEAPVMIEPIAGAPENYMGAPISLDFQRADIHNILRILADVSGFNIITSDTVKGTVTMKLRNVPWDQALDVILRNNGLDKIQEGNIIRVATRAEIQAEKSAEEELQKTEVQVAPLVTHVVDVNYELASAMKGNLESIKSERGSVDINERTNTLIVKDTREKVAEMLKLIERLDKREPQVLIESRIVEVSHQATRELGVQWGGFNSAVTGGIFPHTIGVTGGLTPGGPNAPQGGTAVNTAGANVATGAIGITLGHINGTALLDAKLLAMENAGDGRIVSMPKITTMNNKKAVIESGREVPYSTTSSDGTKTEFKKAVLSLEVTPHVTPNDLVRLEIAAKKDAADFANNTPAGPPILTKRAMTEVLVANGDTAVLGGLFSNSDQDTTRKVPGLGDIPLLGWMFKGNTGIKTSEELLIFITPKVLE